MRQKTQPLLICLLVTLLTLGACEKEPRKLTTEEYLLFNQEPPLWLVAIDLEGADLRGLDLSNADLRNANLQGANLRNAKLNGANLLYTDLRRATLNNANLEGANVRGANFSGAIMDGILLRNAEYNGYTRWRADFDPEAAGALKKSN
jgi:hypothetical protein